MSNRETVASGGCFCDGSDTRRAFLYLYPNESAVDGDVSEDGRVVNAIEGAMDVFVSNDCLDYYEIVKYTGGPMNLSYEEGSDEIDTAHNFGDKFSSWLDSSSDNMFPDYRGLHYGVSDGFDHAGGPSVNWYSNNGYNFDPTEVGHTAFKEALWMMLGTKSDNSDLIRSFSIQEPLHGFISSKLSEQNGLTTDDGFHGDHQLGKVYEWGGSGEYGATSPMATLWADDTDDQAYDGQCTSDQSWQGKYDQLMTDCTLQAMRDTANAEF
ncbi:hypothetical protein NGM10_02550 [Halorussus salilacus]|uniref:hypothetical protein n=1 Tax=Halorussus salilacus TaxID=2953750 RepID=UPI00209CACE2|nr:hypothetical protein [Halorussus salilacus]USZ68631.1 hypothetical protein NGM10_02550 [Halorussus salilacus]